MNVTELTNKKTDLMFHRFTVEEYHKLAEVNILHEDDRVELIEGRIIEMTPIGSWHAACVKRLIDLFAERLKKRSIIGAQDPIDLNKQTEPEPDIAILKRRSDFYAERHPVPDDILLIIEVADTSIDYDKTIKIPLYAKSNIKEVWLVNLLENTVEVYIDPSPEGYKRIMQYQNNQTISPKSFPDIVVKVSEILGLSS